MAARAQSTTPEALLARAALLRVLAQAYAFPGPGQAARLHRDLAKVSVGSPSRTDLAKHLACARRALRATDEAGFAADYLRLFAGSGPVRLHETAYGDGRRLAGREIELSDLNGFYHAFGLELGPTDPDLPDHLAVELEFLSLLRVKQAYAIQQHLKPKARVTAEAADKFLAEHLGRWIPAWRAAMDEAAVPSPHRELARLVEAVVARECQLTRVRPQPFLGLPPDDGMQADQFVCPQAAA